MIQMTIQEMHRAVYEELHKTGSWIHGDLDGDQVDYFLNTAQEEFVKQRLSFLSNYKQRGFEANIKRLEDLRELVYINYTDSIAPESGAREVELDLAADHMFLLNLRVVMRYDPCKVPTQTSPIAKVPARVAETEQVFEIQRSPFHRSTHKSPVATIHEDQIRVFQGERFLVIGIEADYVRQPRKLSLTSEVSCELAPHTHLEIVKIAVNSILESLQSPRVQTNEMKIQKME
jgi:hypothetical protein